MAYATLKQAPEFIASLKPFKGNSIWAEKFTDVYSVYSYSTLMLEIRGGVITYLDERKYSVTTSKHQGRIAQGIHGRTFSPNAIIHTR